MEYRKLGNSGLKLSALSLGSWLTFGKQVGNNIAEELMITAYENGINFFDNAEIYSRGKSEIVMGEILKKLSWDRTSYVVSSKVFFGLGDAGPNQRGLSRKHIVEGCNGALNRLQLDYLDLLFCHRPDKETPIEETVYTMDSLIRQGKILYWGTSEWSASEIMEAHLVAKQNHLIGPVMEQPQYNMYTREKMEKEYLHLFRYHGMGTTIWSPLGSGVLSGKYNNGFPDDTRLGIAGLEWLKEKVMKEDYLAKIREISTIANDLGVSMATLAIAWCLKNEHVSTVLLGASKVSQLEENLKSIEVSGKIDAGIMQRIDEVWENKPELPEY